MQPRKEQENKLERSFHPNPPGGTEFVPVFHVVSVNRKHKIEYVRVALQDRILQWHRSARVLCASVFKGEEQNNQKTCLLEAKLKVHT